MSKELEKKKFTRKVTLIQCNDKRDGNIVSKTIRTITETLTIKVQYKTSRNTSTKRGRKYSFFKTQIRERIIPRCFRAKCSNKKFNTTKPRRDNENCRKSIHKTKEDETNIINQSINLSPTNSIEIINVDSSPEQNIMEYENISSGSLSSFSDDEIDSLMNSTRRRMKDLDSEWNLVPKQVTSTNSVLHKCKDKSRSLSCETLVFQKDDNECLQINNNEAYSPTLSPDKLLCSAMEDNKNIMQLQDSFKKSPSLHKGNILKEETFIDAVITKLEKNLDNSPSLYNVYNIKQELYHDL